MSTAQILEQAGYNIRGTRATCPFCEGRRRLTVSMKGELYYCHRCHKGGSVRSLARAQGLNLLPPRIRRADKPKTAFRAWLSRKMNEMSRAEHRLYRRKVWAETALASFPDMESAWQVLSEWYHAERQFQEFWQSATDKIGRYWMYRHWRQHARG